MTDRRSGRSSYLQYLPPVLWENELTPSAFHLGELLKIFEKILTGIDDGVPVPHNAHSHQSIQETIESLSGLFSPWYTPPEFLAWLASWVELKFPTNGIWDDYQQRKAISQIVQVYRQRGLKAGLDQYLDLYTLSAKQPRVVIDDSNTLLFAWPTENRLAPIYASGLPGPYVHYNVKLRERILYREGLVRPVCIARAMDGSLFIGDTGTPTHWVPRINPGIWHVLPLAHADVSGPPTRPRRLSPRPAWDLKAPVAVVTNQTEQESSYLYVLDDVAESAGTALYILHNPTASSEPAIVGTLSKSALNVVSPVAMVLDPQNGHLLILDRGTNIIRDPYRTEPAIIDVNVQASPITLERHLLPKDSVKEPLALLVRSDGDLLIGEAQRQNETTKPADLLLVQRSDWSVQSLLSGLSPQQNPLVTPCALAQVDSTHILVMDVGLRPYLSSFDSSIRPPYIRLIAEPGAIYQVDLSDLENRLPVVTPASESRQLVFPTAMILHQGLLYICDKGDFFLGKDRDGKFDRVWRVFPHEFGVVIHFSLQRGEASLRERRQISQNIREIIAQEKPAHTLATMAYTIDR